LPFRGGSISKENKTDLAFLRCSITFINYLEDFE